MRRNLASLLQICIIISLAVLAALTVAADRFSINASAQSPSSDQQKRGKQIYVRGTSASSRDILAYVGESSLEIPGSALPCANCHGLDGRGKPEGGVVPATVTWDALTRPYKALQSGGRARGPYTERALDLATTRGVDPSGNKLLTVMPRYQMSPQDMSDLIAYLKILGTDRDTGLSEDKIVIGSVVPARGALADMGAVVRAETIAYFDELNSRGGIYGRRIELRFAETGDTIAVTRGNVERLIKVDQVFAITGAFIAGADKEIATLLQENEVPLIGPLTLNPQTSFPLNRQVFYLLSGVDGQARALLDFAAKRAELKNSGVAVVSTEGEINTTIADALRDESKKMGLSAPDVVTYSHGHFVPEQIAKRLKQTRRDTVFFLGAGDDALAFMKESEKLGWLPSIYFPASGFGKEIFDAPIAFTNRLFISFPTSPADQTEAGVGEFRAFAEKYKLPAGHLAAQISAYVSAKILVEGLKRAGKDLSRERLVQALEGLYEYPTDLTPPVTYGPNRRIGAMGAYIVGVNLEKKQFVPASGWIKVN